MSRSCMNARAFTSVDPDSLLGRIFCGKPLKSAIADLSNIECRSRVNPRSVSTFPENALWMHAAVGHEGTLEIGAVEIGALEIGLAQYCVHQPGIVEIGAFEIGPAQRRFHQVGGAEVGVA